MSVKNCSWRSSQKVDRNYESRRNRPVILHLLYLRQKLVLAVSSLWVPNICVWLNVVRENNSSKVAVTFPPLFYAQENSSSSFKRISWVLCTQLGAEGAEVDCVGTQVWVDSGQTKQVLNLVIPFGRTVTVHSLSKDGVLAGGGVRLKSQPLGVFSSILSDGRVLVCTSPAEQILWSFPYSADAKFFKKGSNSVFKDMAWARVAQHKAVQSKHCLCTAIRFSL